MVAVLEAGPRLTQADTLRKMGFRSSIRSERDGQYVGARSLLSLTEIMEETPGSSIVTP